MNSKSREKLAKVSGMLNTLAITMMASDLETKVIIQCAEMVDEVLEETDGNEVLKVPNDTLIPLSFKKSNITGIKTVVFDFDGVIHSYSSGWKGVDNIPDPPVEGIKEAIQDIRAAGYRCVVVSTRCTSVEGLTAVIGWLSDNGIEVDEVCAEKPPAICYIDDRAICFDGSPEGLLNKIKNFEPWYLKI